MFPFFSSRPALAVLAVKDKRTAEKVFDIEREVDDLTKQFGQNHLDRLKNGDCDPRSSVVFAELINTLERISDHAHNIAMATVHGF